MITTTQIILAILGSGAFSALISAFVNYLADRGHQTRQLKIDYVKEQLSKLYGPICYFLGQNELIISHVNLVSKKIIEKANENNFGYSQNELLEVVKKDTQVNFQFSQTLLNNNDEVMKILKETWHLIDLLDIEAFQEFQLNVIRFKTELDETKFPKLSLLVSNELPEIMKNYPQYISKVKLAFEAKKKELKRLESTG